MTREKALISVALVGALVLVGAAYFYRSKSAPTGARADIIKKAPISKGRPILGSPGSEHSHASFNLFLEDEVFDFAQPRYMLRDQRAHFENGEGLTLHKHATGVTIPYFLATLGVKLDPACLSLDTGGRYCTDQKKKIRLFVNDREVTEPDLYEVRDGDRILLNYGNDSDVKIRLKLNGLPPVISPFEKPF